MPNFNLYSFSDKIPNLPSYLQERQSLVLHEKTFIKLLIGCLDITHSISNDNANFSNEHNYLIIGFPANTTFDLSLFENTISPIPLNNLERYLSHNSRYKNQGFYEELVLELTTFFYKKTNSPTTAFVHLYRILERISYIFPLIYASKFEKYTETYSVLKDFFKDPKSELGFFNKFVKQLLKTDINYTSGTLIFEFNHSENEINERHYSLINKFFANRFTGLRPNQVTMKYSDLFDFMITIRNRYFHFQSAAEENISPKDIVDSDVFFEVINDHLLNWIAYIYFKILEHQINTQ